MNKEQLEKADKLLTASERGDESVRDFAKTKYDEYLKENGLKHEDVLMFRGGNVRPKNAKVFVFRGVTYNTGKEFEDWYMTQSIRDRFKIAQEIAKIKLTKNK